MKKGLKGASIYILIFIGILIFVTVNGVNTQKTVELSYDEFVAKLGSDQIKEVQIDGNKVSGVLSDDTAFATYVPGMLALKTGEMIIEHQANADKLSVQGVEPANTPFLLEILPTVIMI